MKFYKLSLFALITFCFTALPSAEPMVWNGSNKFANWGEFTRVKGEIIDGNLMLTSMKFDCMITNNRVNINPNDYNAFTFRYRATDTSNRNGEFYFAHVGEKFSDSRKWRIPPLIADGQWHTLTVSATNFDSWKEGGNIVRLRFDPTNGAGGQIEISEMKLEYIDRLIEKKLPVWNETNKFSGWNVTHNLKKELRNGNLFLTVTGPDCRLSNLSTSIDTKKYNAFTFRYRAENIVSGGELYFAHPDKSFSDSCSWKIPPLNADGKWHTITIRPTNLEAWKKGETISRLRFDPTNSPTGIVEISEMKFVFLDEPIETPTQNSASNVKSDAPKPIETPTQNSASNVKSDAPDWPKVKSELKMSQKIGEHYFLGKMVRATQDVPQGKVHSFWVRRKFSLRDKPVHGLLQFTADDCAEAYVNGSRVGFSNDWQTTFYADVTKHLKSGKNILAFEYYNDNGAGGMLCELYIQYADGSSERINSDKSFICSSTRVENWNQLKLDDSKWENVVEQQPPPNRPWVTVLPYRYFEKIQKINEITISPKEVNAGDNIKLSFYGEGKLPQRNISFTIEFRTKNNLLWTENLILPKENFFSSKDNQWSADLNYTTPKYLNSNYIYLKFISDEFVCTNKANSDLNIKYIRMKSDPNFPAIKTWIAKKTDGVTFMLDGKPFMPLWGQANPMRRSDKKSRINDAKIDLLTVNCRYGNWWIGCDKYDFSKLDDAAEDAGRENPEAYFIWDITLRLPREWGQKYPHELSRTEKGNIADPSKTTFSFSSQQALQDMEKALEKIISYLENSPYANRIIGYRISGGETIEWLGWNSSEELDFSDCSKKAFIEFAQKHYPELKSPVIPSAIERRSLDKGLLLWDQQKHLNCIAFFDFYSNSVADMIIALTAKAKSMVGDRKIIGTFYGYSATLHWTGISQIRSHYALKKLLDANSVDIVMSPNSYTLRELGDIVGEMKPFASLHNNKILSIIEDDTRTHNGRSVKHSGGSGAQTITEAHSIAILRRNMGVAACRGVPFYTYPLVGGEEWDFPAAVTDFKIFRELGHYLSTKNIERRTEIALVVSEDSIKSMPMNQKTTSAQCYLQQYRADGTVRKYSPFNPVLNRETFIGNQGDFCRSGAPIDILLAEDIKDHPGNYKLYVFLNSYKYDDAFFSAIEKLKQRNCTLLWLYAPGYIYNMSNSVENMHKLIGIKVKQFAEPAVAAVSLADKRIMGSPTAVVSPLFYSVDPTAEVIGTYSNGNAGIVAQRTGQALSIFSGVWQLDIPFILDIAKRSGVHIYSEGSDPLEANSSLVMLHARFPGPKSVKLPCIADVVDVFNRKIIAKNVSAFTFNAKLHETSLFYYGHDAEGLLEKLNNPR